MSFSSWETFLHMGGYASYVWGSYGLGWLAMTWAFMSLQRHHRRQVRLIRETVQRQAALHERKHES